MRYLTTRAPVTIDPLTQILKKEKGLKIGERGFHGFNLDCFGQLFKKRIKGLGSDNFHLLGGEFGKCFTCLVTSLFKIIFRLM